MNTDGSTAPAKSFPSRANRYESLKGYCSMAQPISFLASTKRSRRKAKPRTSGLIPEVSSTWHRQTLQAKLMATTPFGQPRNDEIRGISRKRRSAASQMLQQQSSL
ncbi:hypothetical protein HZH66_002476 [Vespula vulgaris]|uniref:Uncharacterized protein n=1 Tax=Vespula vulgaris TaxID=7454 RepID=A0A834KN70_VESVU|nr:hypothetical protein HZH66_002476 [Vespula vulgaris]